MALPAWLTFSLHSQWEAPLLGDGAFSITAKGENIVVLGAVGEIVLVDVAGNLIERPAATQPYGMSLTSCHWDAASNLLIVGTEGGFVFRLPWGDAELQDGVVVKDPDNPASTVIDLYGVHQSGTTLRAVDSSLSRLYTFHPLPAWTEEGPEIAADSVITLPDSIGEVTGNIIRWGPGWLVGRASGAANGATNVSYFNYDFTQRTNVPLPATATVTMVGLATVNGGLFGLDNGLKTVFRFTPNASPPEANMASETLKPDDTVDSFQATSGSGTLHAALQADDNNKVSFAPNDSYLVVGLEDTTAPADATITLTMQVTDSVITSPLANPLTIYLQDGGGGPYDDWAIVPGTTAGTLLHAVPGTFTKAQVDDMRLLIDGTGDVTATVDAIGVEASWSVAGAVGSRVALGLRLGL